MLPPQGSSVAVEVVIYVVSSASSSSTLAEETKGVDHVGQDAVLCNGQSGPSHKKDAFCSCCILQPRLEMSAGFLSVFTQRVYVVGGFLVSLIRLFTNLGGCFVDNHDNTHAESV